MCQPSGPQQDWEQGWLWRGLGETDVVVPGQRVKSPNINSGDIWLKFWGEKDVFQGPTFLSQPERGGQTAQPFSARVYCVSMASSVS